MTLTMRSVPYRPRGQIEIGQPTPPLIKAALFEQAKDLYADWYGPQQFDEADGLCLYWAQVGARVLRDAGLRPVIQAGSAFWRIAPPNTTGDTHFGYEWDLSQPFSIAQLFNGLLPEVHIWIGLPESHELVDFTAGQWPKCAAKHGHAWQTPLPPEYLWVNDTLPANTCVYRPDLEAIRFVLRFIADKQQ